MNFRIEKGHRENSLFLKDGTGHCYLLSSVENLLDSNFFRSHNPELIPVFEKAKEMMIRGQVGPVNVKPI